jgi:hypothetical protein
VLERRWQCHLTQLTLQTAEILLLSFCSHSTLHLRSIINFTLHAIQHLLLPPFPPFLPAPKNPLIVRLGSSRRIDPGPRCFSRSVATRDAATRITVEPCELGYNAVLTTLLSAETFFLVLTPFNLKPIHLRRAVII